MYSLTNQIQRAAVSIPANIAEGCGKNGDADFARYLQIAVGSASELEYLLLLSHDLCYLEDATYQNLISDLVEVRQMLNALMHRVKNNSYQLIAVINLFLLMTFSLWYKKCTLL